MNYHCPYCARKPEIKAQCRLEEEIRQKEEAERRAKEKMEKEKEDRGKADNVAGAAYEFWTLMGEVMEELHDEINAEMMHELPVPSPDSITVTTEFGVSEEPNNSTVITAGPPPPSTNASIPEAAEFAEELEDGIGPLADTVDTANLTAQLAAAEALLAEFGMVDDEGEDVNLDDEDFDAESSLIDEFINDGGLTPTTNNTASVS